MAQNSTEIERKWLIEDSPEVAKRRRAKIVQGYLAISQKGNEVRLRRKDERFFQTVKSGSGLKRSEVEVEISRKQFKKLWPMTRGRRLEKVRYALKWEGTKIEFDIYRKKLSGLKVAEVEFKSTEEAESFSPPDWFGREVTRDPQYKNSTLASRKMKQTTKPQPPKQQLNSAK